MRRTLLSRIASLALAILIPTALALAQGAHTLEGRVILPNGSAPPTPVKVTLTFSGRVIYETFTDLSGRFSFSGLQRGRYQLIAETNEQAFETTRDNRKVTAFGADP